MILNKQATLEGTHNLPISLDITYQKNDSKKPLVVFCHGFKGYKDWGAWSLVAEAFARSGFVFLKFNFSHNGTTPKNLKDFENLDAFSENNYSKELDDLNDILDYVTSDVFPLANETDAEKIYLIGHSRGGGAVLIKTFEDFRVKKVAAWAAIDSYDRFGSPTQIEAWKQKGVHIFINGRTGQEMPIKFQFYEDYIKNIKRLDIKNAVSNTTKPILVVHGTKDAAVLFESAENIVQWSKNGSLFSVEDATHVFGSAEPFLAKKLPTDLQLVVDETSQFFLK